MEFADDVIAVQVDLRSAVSKWKGPKPKKIHSAEIVFEMVAMEEPFIVGLGALGIGAAPTAR